MQGSAKRWALGRVNPAPWLPLAAGGEFTQPRAHLPADPCTSGGSLGCLSWTPGHVSNFSGSISDLYCKEDFQLADQSQKRACQVKEARGGNEKLNQARAATITTDND